MDNFNFLRNFIEVFKEAPLIKERPLSLNSAPKSKVEKLFHGIALGDFNNDEEASQYLYGKPPSTPAYQMLKSRLEKKLIRQLFFIDFEDNYFSTSSRHYFEGLTKALAVRKLMGLGNNSIALQIIKSGVKIAKKYKFYEVGLLLVLSQYMIEKGFSVVDSKKTGQNSSKLNVDFFLTNFLLEYELDDNYATILNNLSKGGVPVEEEINKACNKLISLKSKTQNFNKQKIIKLHYAIAAASIFHKKYKETIEICDECLNELANDDISNIHILCLLKAQCYLHLNKFENAKQAMQEAEIKKIRHGVNWAAFFDLYFFISARSGEYAALAELYDKATADPKFSIRPDMAKESWRQYGLLLLLLIKLGKIPPSEQLDLLKPKLRPAKLMNEMPEYAKDKAGLNLAIRILQVVIMLTNKKYEEFEDALSTLQAYIQRYKRQHPEIFRCDLLVKMLSVIPKVDYNAQRTEWRAKPFLEKMNVPPERLPLKITEMEVVPYERLWSYILEFLRTLKRRPYTVGR